MPGDWVGTRYDTVTVTVTLRRIIYNKVTNLYSNSKFIFRETLCRMIALLSIMVHGHGLSQRQVWQTFGKKTLTLPLCTDSHASSCPSVSASPL